MNAAVLNFYEKSNSAFSLHPHLKMDVEKTKTPSIWTINISQPTFSYFQKETQNVRRHQIIQAGQLSW